MKFKLPVDVQDDEINMAPMIDMVFLLLIFFMAASHLTKLDRTPVELPVASKASVPENTAGRQMITLRSTDTTGENVEIFMNLATVTLDQIEPLVAKHLAENPGAEICLRADRYVKHKHVREVMAACAKGGAAQVIFAAFESGGPKP